MNLRKSNLGNFFVGKLSDPSHDLIRHKNGPPNKFRPFHEGMLELERSVLRTLISVRW